MKKYILISLATALVFAGCVKDEQNEPLPPLEISYEDIVINELISKDTSDVYFVDEEGNATDWVELHNKGNKAINVAGMWITDLPGTEDEYQQIPSGSANVTTIGPKGYLVLICGAKDASGGKIPTEISNGKVFIEMGISSSGDFNLGLYNPSKVEIDMTDDFNGLADDKSFGRTADGGPEWSTLATKTPNAPNDGNAPPVQGKLIINEFMASNDSWTIPGEDPGETFPDWIEIYNTGETPIDMGGWYATDDMTDSVQYQIPTDIPELTTVPPKGFLILYCDGLGDGLHTNFKLGSGGEDVAIYKEGLPYTEKFSYCDVNCDAPNPGTDNSTGRDGDGTFTWVVFEKDSNREPSPGAPNN